MSRVPHALAALALAAALVAAPGRGDAAGRSPVPAKTRQLLLSTSAGWGETRARLQAYERAAAGEPWRAAGAPIDAALGRSGLGWGRGLHAPAADGPQKREGDGRSPAGVFDLRLVTGEDPRPPAGVRLTYREATPTLRCVDDPRSRFYNRLVDEAETAKDWASAEEMRRADGLYRFVVWVGHNDSPPVPGAGSCIFLHLRARPDSTTAGCTAFDPEPMERLLRWLDPAARPVLVQLPEPERRARGGEWGLPAPDP